MNYDLGNVKTVGGPIEYSLDQAMPFGDMPSSMLMAKFEETDIGYDEGGYDDYARAQLTNWGPDTNLLAHEEPRIDVGRRAGILNGRLYGHRGDSSVDIDPYRPEYFDGDIGPGLADPRGIATDPDMKQLVKQSQARTRFVRWTKDGSEHITGGGRAENQLMADQQRNYLRSRDIFKSAFDRQLDGRREGLRRDTYDHVSALKKTVLVQSYGDSIKDAGLTPQHRATIICNKLNVHMREFRDECADADFAVAKYGQNGRHRKTSTTMNAMTHTAHDGYLDDSNSARMVKTAGILMARVTKCQRMTAQDAEFSGSNVATAAKSVAPSRDLAAVVKSVSLQTDFGKSSVARQGKVAAPQLAAHGVLVTASDHDIPAHMLLNAEIIRKTLREGGDMRAIRDLTIRDATAAILTDLQSSAAKTAAMRIATGRKLATTGDMDTTDGSQTVNYRTLKTQIDRSRVVNSATDTRWKASDDTPYRRTDHTNYRITGTGDVIDSSNFGVNDSAERHGGRVGTKFTRHLEMQDARVDEISIAN